jgi:hypothetical protein
MDASAMQSIFVPGEKNMGTSRYPLLCQINTRVWLTELSQKLGHLVTLD